MAEADAHPGRHPCAGRAIKRGGPKTGAIGCAACCIGGAIAGGVTQYTNCTIQARAEFVTALQNARARLNRCMADCGIVIAEE